jgi:hypothetical protein
LFLYVGLAYFVSGLLVKLMPGFDILDMAIGLAASLLMPWIVIRVFLTMLNLEAGKKPMDQKAEGAKAWSLYLSFWWVGLLTGLVTFATLLLFILPGIYFAIALAFSQTILLDQGIKGTQALAASRALVRGRWWPTFGRLLAGGIVFGLLVGILVMVVVGVLVTVVGPDKFGDTASGDPLFVGVGKLLYMIIYGAFAPLLIGFNIKMYRALQKTR